MRSVVLAGAGKGFCAGADVSEWSEAVEGAATTPGCAWERNAHALVQEVHDLPKPTVAVLHGAAVGAGLDLACACDFRVASDDAVFFCAYTWVGYNPDAGGTWLYPRLMGLEAAKRFVYTGERWDAATAQGHGLVSEVVPRDELQAAGARLAAELASGPSVAIGLAKGLLQTAGTRTLAEQLEAEKAAGKVCAETDDHREALAAFGEKRVARVPRPLSARRLLRPRSVAFIGGGLAPGRARRSAAHGGFDGPVYAVHPRNEGAVPLDRRAARRRRTRRSSASTRRPRSTWCAQLAAIGAGGAACYAAGFAEAGDAGAGAGAGGRRPATWRCSARTATA